VTAVASIKRFRLKMFTVSGLDFLAWKPFLDVEFLWKSMGNPRGIRLFQLPIFFLALRGDARNALAQSRQLIL